MHSMIITFAALLLAASEWCGLGLPSGLMLSVVAISVVIVGIPHGAADHLTGRRLLEPIVGVAWAPLFFGAYLFIGCLVLLGWHLMPTTTILLFFAVAAWHFGTEDRDEQPIGRLTMLRAIASGGLVIWIPCTMQGVKIESILPLISETITLERSQLIVSTVAASSPFLGLLVILDCVSEFQTKHPIENVGMKELLSSTTARYAALSILFSVADPLLSFGVYFSGWHSIRGLSALQKQFDCSLASLVKRLTPLSLVTVGLVSLGSLAWSSGLTVSETTIRWLFLGLSAIAVPHLLLDTIVDSHSLTSWLMRKTASGAIL